MRRPQAVLLDALGTLVELEPPAEPLRRELAAAGVPVPLPVAERAIAAEIAYYRAHMHSARDRVTLTELRWRCAEVVRTALPPSAALAALSRERITELLLGSLRFRAFAEAAEALAALRQEGVRVAVVSNWDCSLPEVLARVGLAGLLDGVVTSAQAGAAKPDPAIFRAALELVGVPAERALHAGDSLIEDVQGPAGAGIKAVLVDRSGTRRTPGVRTISNLRELSGLWS